MTDRPKAKRTVCKVLDSPLVGLSRNGGKIAPDWAKAIAREECSRSELTLIWNTQGKSTRKMLVVRGTGDDWTVTKASVRSRRATYVSGLANSYGRTLYHYGDPIRVRTACITINAGATTSALYQLAVLLHEIAHINVGPNHDHDATWQKEAVRLYRKYGLLQKVLDGKWYGYECERKAVESALKRSRSGQDA